MLLLYRVLLFLLMLPVCSCSFIGTYKPDKKGMHEGYDLKVWIDGIRTEPIEMPYFQGVNFFNQISGPGLWQIDGEISKRPQIKYEMDNEVLGKFISARALFERAPINGTSFWDPYYSNLSNETPEFEPGYVVQSSHFQNAEDFTSRDDLPSGTYLIRIYVYGSKSWDTQSIFVKIN